MTFDLVSTLIGFLVGAATGAAGGYFANKYTDRRREQEAAKHARKQFLVIRKQMSKLLTEMKADLARDGNGHVREFVVLRNKGGPLGLVEKHRFTYYEDEHDNLRGKLDILENADYVTDVMLENTPIFRMSELFVELLTKLG